MTGFRFEQPLLLLALLLLPGLFFWRRRRGRAPVWLVPYAASWVAASSIRSRRWTIALLYTALALLTGAAARPQRMDSHEQIVSRGYDLMLAVDLSTSMLAEDYRGPRGSLNRLEAIRPILKAFITNRPHDRIGVVLFAGRAFTLAPLSTDHHWLERQVSDIKIGLIEDGTAIGDGLGIALTNLESSHGTEPSVGAFVILLTDGANTSGSLAPPQATAIARHRRIPVYTIGAGRNGMVPFPVFDSAGRRVGTREQPSSIDVEALRTISAETGGRYFDAGSRETAAAAFAAIDRAKKTEFRVKTKVKITELYPYLAVPALVCLLLASWGLWTRAAMPVRGAES